MTQKKAYYDCHHFGKPECKYSDDELLMKKLVHQVFVENKYDKYLADEVNEFRCSICDVFKHIQY